MPVDNILIVHPQLALPINMDCVFCNIVNEKDFLIENDLAVAFYDSFPVSTGHTLIIPKRHVETYFELTNKEMNAIFDLSKEVKKFLDKEYHPDGYNVGFNVGVSGGQSVMHCHMHIIPRYKGDQENPRGGIRKVVKNKINY